MMVDPVEMVLRGLAWKGQIKVLVVDAVNEK